MWQIPCLKEMVCHQFEWARAALTEGRMGQLIGAIDCRRKILSSSWGLSLSSTWVGPPARSTAPGLSTIADADLSGFLTTFSLLARDRFTVGEISWLLVKVFFG